MADKIPGNFEGTQPPIGDNNFINGETAPSLEALRKCANEADKYLNFFVGSLLDEPDVTISSDGSNVFFLLEKKDGGDIRYRATGETKTLDCTPITSVILVAGTDSSPQTNYVFINHSTGLLESNITGFPEAPHSSMGEYYVRTAAFHVTRGVLGKTHRNHVFTPGDNGHMEHINEARRKQPCIFENGLLLTASGSGTATVNFALASGQLYRMHLHDVSGISSPAEFFVNNDELVPDATLTNLHEVETYSDGSSNINQYCVYIIFIAHLDDTTGLFLLKPNAGYNSETEAYTDPDQTADLNIPKPYAGASIYVGRVVARRTASATTIFEINTDVRSLVPGAIAGGGLSGVPDHASDHRAGGADELFSQNLDTTDSVAFKNVANGAGTTAISAPGDYVIDLDAEKLQIVDATNEITINLSTTNRPTVGEVKEVSVLVKAGASDVTLTYPTGKKILESKPVDTTATANTELLIVLLATGPDESDIIWGSEPVEVG